VSNQDFWIYTLTQTKRRVFVESNVDGNWKHSFELAPLQHEQARAVAMCKKPFGEGAERFAYRFFELASDRKTIVGSPMVAKESRFLLDGDENGVGEEMARKQYVRLFCKTQQMAANIATAFNKKMDSLPSVDTRTPRIRFLDCSIYELNDPEFGVLSVLVEEKVDQEKWQKWNSNHGYVKGGAASAKDFEQNCLRSTAFDFSPLPDLGVLEEESDEDADSSDDEQVDRWYQMLPKHFYPGEVAQAFSHFSYLHMNRKRLVCDLQGVYDEKSNMLLLSDPAMHYYNPVKWQRIRVHGRTDHGKKGIEDFLQLTRTTMDIYVNL
jgi:Alpha-kinase family